MNISLKLNELSLSTDNTVVIGSGILNALNLRACNDIDIVVPPAIYEKLKQTQRFTIGHSYGREILADDIFEIGTSWGVLGKNQTFDDLVKKSQIIEGVRYITIDFLLAVKQSWLKESNVRQKDVDDVALIQQYSSTLPR